MTQIEIQPTLPPSTLLHGTADRFMKKIELEGLSKQNRHHVHLTESEPVAKAVGSRYGKIVLLQIDTEGMAKSGYKFYKTANNVWLVEDVPSSFITVI